MAIIEILLRPSFLKLSGVRHLSNKPKFGLLFDIDGVIVRGKTVLPPVPDAFKRLATEDGKFQIPTIFVTNSGNTTRKKKAAELSEWIGCKVNESQVVVAHSPLEKFKQFHDKQVLISGQGPIKEIAKELGFKKTTTIEELVANFPNLDYVNVMKRNPQSGPIDPNFPVIEALVLLNEPISWETPLQLMVDLLMTNGMPKSLSTIPYPHIPVLACNMDLLWVSAASIPRYGHGAFLLCLESLYKKVTGKDLIYSALVGKPSQITYYYANEIIQSHAKSIGVNENIDTIYAVGDNINTDVFGANLYDKYLARAQDGAESLSGRILERILGKDLRKPTSKACISILVETGVHKRDSEFMSDHSPRDFIPVEEALYKPAFIVEDASKAIELALKEEKFS
ncbi:haloacid dehalogenase-like hydrolase domain-containing 5 [Prorops nasuta]|uniref:haloacid dehalogenase-like hydrolase domain-containing 5 n=1 Tax=Prorops nasuta TaxID=863751 RepID=UPI0034CD3226